MAALEDEFVLGKRAGPAVDSAATAEDSCRLFVTCKRNKITFLVDTGAEVSVLPANKKDRLTESSVNLTAANRSSIKTFGYRTLVVNVPGLRREFRHPFIVADVSHPILGADFIRNFDLLPDLRRRRLIDTKTKLATRTLQSISVSALRARAPEDDAKDAGSHGDAVRSEDAALPDDAALSDDAASAPRDAPASSGKRRPEILCNLRIATNLLRDDIDVLLRKYPDLLRPHFSTKDVKHSVVHHIRTTGPPVSARPRRLPAHKLRPVKADFEHMVSQGICVRANSAWASAITVVPKKNGEWRSCGDYRALNAVTLPDRYPIPNLLDFNQRISGATRFATIDLVRAYNQIPVAPEDVDKTAVTTPFGSFAFLAMPFGLRNAAQTFQRFMDEVVRGLDFVYVYIDDILVASADDEQHLRNLDTLFSRLNQFGITINTAKSSFIGDEVDFLGFRVSAAGISPLSAKVEAISSMTQPKTVKELLRFLGAVNFYRACIPRAAEIQEPLYDLTADCRTPTGKFRNKELVWNDDAAAAFAATKKALEDAVMLGHPDPDAELALFTDASDRAIGASLNQRVSGQWQPLGFFARKLTPVQRSARYSAYSRELLAIKESIKHFRTQVEGRHFVVFTDHKPLTFAFIRPHHDAPEKTIRDLDYISQFTTDIRHVSGEDNVVADALSRVEAICFDDFTDVAVAQQTDEEMLQLMQSNSSLKLAGVPILRRQAAHRTRSETNSSPAASSRTSSEASSSPASSATSSSGPQSATAKAANYSSARRRTPTAATSLPLNATSTAATSSSASSTNATSPSATLTTATSSPASSVTQLRRQHHFGSGSTPRILRDLTCLGSFVVRRSTKSTTSRTQAPSRRSSKCRNASSGPT